MGTAVALTLICMEGLQNCAASTTYWQSYRGFQQTYFTSSRTGMLNANLSTST